MTSGREANPLSVIEQITYLLFIKRLDELHTVEERKAATLKIPMERRIHVFPCLRTLGAEGSAFSQHIKDARLRSA